MFKLLRRCGNRFFHIDCKPNEVNKLAVHSILCTHPSRESAVTKESSIWAVSQSAGHLCSTGIQISKYSNDIKFIFIIKFIYGVTLSDSFRPQARQLFTNFIVQAHINAILGLHVHEHTILLKDIFQTIILVLVPVLVLVLVRCYRYKKPVHRSLLSFDGSWLRLVASWVVHTVYLAPKLI